MNELARGRLDELLADHAFAGLAGAESAELDRLLASHPDVDPEATDRVVAALDVALATDFEPLPAAVRANLEARAVAWLAEGRGLALTPAPARRPRVAWLPWAVAAAAVIALAVTLLPRPAASPERLIAGGAAVLPWAANDLGVRGEVIWSPSRQAGWMRFDGLASNDPSVEQYQLWIFDASRDERFPVDGGVFDVPDGGGPVEVPIDPRLRVDAATMFAVTIEPPGGVVVSDRSRLILLAASE